MSSNNLTISSLFSTLQLNVILDFKDSANGELVEIYERCVYDYEMEICDIQWEYIYEKTLSLNKKLNYKYLQ